MEDYLVQEDTVSRLEWYIDLRIARAEAARHEAKLVQLDYEREVRQCK